MRCKFAKITYTKCVTSIQKKYGTLDWNKKAILNCNPRNEIGEREINLIKERNSFYMSSVNENGWPYIQHRGGDKGFLRISDKNTLIFPDFKGNKQYITIGNINFNNKVCLILIDYPSKKRLKILGYAEVIETDEELFYQHHGEQEKFIERFIKIHIEAFDWNCSKYIVPRYESI